jgi:lysophospholipase L1-like esterase
MKFMKFIFLALFAIALGCSGRTRAPGDGITSLKFVQQPVLNATPGRGDIYVIGDSLAAGTGSANPAVTPTGCLQNGFHDPTTTLAIPGKRSFEILDQVTQVEQASPKLIFVSSAGNDTIGNINSPGSYPAEKTMKEMNEMFDRLLATKALVVYLGIFPVIPGVPPEQLQRLTDVAQLAASKGVLVVDGMDGFWNNPNVISPDRIHPNTHGYEVMCNRILGTLQDYYP